MKAEQILEGDEGVRHEWDVPVIVRHVWDVSVVVRHVWDVSVVVKACVCV